jgi:sorbose reductase
MSDSKYIGKAYQVNILSYESVATAAESAIRDFNGRLDVFVANSGIPWTQGPSILGELDHYRKVVTTDLDGTFYCARAAGLHWRRQKKEQTTIDGRPLEPAFREGSFIATASMSGHVVNIPQLQAPFNAAKAGVIQLCEFPALLKF